MQQSQRIVNNLNQRMKKKGFPGRMILEDGRRFLLAGLDKPCRYCRQVVRISTMSLDHPMPVSRGGKPYEAECICQGCNMEKAELTAEEFQKLTDHIRTYSPEARQHIHGALKGGAAYVRLVTQMRGQAAAKRDAGRKNVPAQEAGDVHLP
jgi:hypothetical protein